MTNPSFKLGLVCHETLEYAGQIWQDKEEFNNEDRAEILNYYDEMSVKNGLGDYGLHILGKELVERKLNNFWKESGRKIIGLEQLFGTDEDNEVHTDQGVPLIGAMDMVTEVDEDTLLVVDYKTSNTMPTVDDMKHDIQLSIYDLVASIKWPQYKRIILRLDFLKHDPMDTYRTPAERQAFSDYIKKLHDEMVALKKREAEPSLNLFCPWCDFKDYCRTYKKAYEKGNYSFQAAEGYRDADLINEWTKMRDIKKIIEAREREMAMLIMEKIKRGGKEVNNGQIELYVRSNSRVDYDVRKVLEYVPKRELAKMVNLKKAQVKKYIEKRPRVRDVIEDSAQRNFTRPFLATRKLKKKKGE